MDNKADFIQLLATKTNDTERVTSLFETYHRLLLEANSRVNLISRQTNPNHIWTFHYYDSLFPLCYDMDFTGKKVLDFGTGGGLPGVPLAIMFPSVTMHLLDSKTKKIIELDRMIKKLDLNNCSAICTRLEELSGEMMIRRDIEIGHYDIIVCRSVLMTRSILKKLSTLLSEKGYLLLYKAKKVEEELLKWDIEIFNEIRFPWRERQLIKVHKNR